MNTFLSSSTELSVITLKILLNKPGTSKKIYIYKGVKNNVYRIRYKG